MVWKILQGQITGQQASSSRIRGRLGPWGMESLSGTATSSTINIGTLVLGIYDPAAKQLVWIGAASKTVDPGKNQGKNRKNLDKATQKLLKDFPPRRK